MATLETPSERTLVLFDGIGFTLVPENRYNEGYYCSEEYSMDAVFNTYWAAQNYVNELMS